MIARTTRTARTAVGRALLWRCGLLVDLLLLAALLASAAVLIRAAAATHDPSERTLMPEPMPAVRPGASVTAAETLGVLYADAADAIAADLAQAIAQLSADPDRRSAQYGLARAATLAAQVQRTLTGLGRRADPLLTTQALTARRRGEALAAKQAADLGFQDTVAAATAGGAAAAFGGVNAGAADAVARDMAARLNAAAGRYGAEAVTLFRTLSVGPLAGSAREAEVNRAISRGLTGGDPRAADRALRDLFRGDDAAAESYRRIGARMIEVGGWTGPVRAYTEMVVRTRTAEAQITAQHEELADLGLDLVQIIGSNSANWCTRYLGLVCSLSGRRPDYPALASLGGPPFHPNCTKSTVAFDPDISSPALVRRAEQAARLYQRDVAAGLIGKDITASQPRGALRRAS